MLILQNNVLNLQKKCKVFRKKMGNVQKEVKILQKKVSKYRKSEVFI